jgi:hypothetical protein
MASEWGRWQDSGGVRLSAFLRALDGQFQSRLESIVSELPLEMAVDYVLQDRWDVPGRTYIFSSSVDPTTRSLQVQLLSNGRTEYSMVGGAAWLDIGSLSSPERIRFWCHTPVRRRQPWYVRLGGVPPPAFRPDFLNEGVSKRVAAAMAEVLSLVLSWRFDSDHRSWIGDNVVFEDPVNLPVTSDTRRFER